MFRIGQKVVCVDAYQESYDGEDFSTLKKGEIYTIQGIKSCKCHAAVYVGIPLPLGAYNVECETCGFEFSKHLHYHSSYRFRAIDEAFGENVTAAFEEQFQLITATS